MADFLSQYTGQAEFTTQAQPPVPSPRNPSVSSITPAEATISWQAPSGGLPSGAVYVLTVAGVTHTLTATTFRVTGLTRDTNTSYTVAVRASDNRLSATVGGNFTTAQIGTIINLRQVAGDAGNARPSFTWDVGGSGFADDYEVSIHRSNPTRVISNGVVTTRTVTADRDLNDGEVVRVFVNPRYAGNYGRTLRQVRGDFTVAVVNPVGTITSVPSANGATVTWDAPEGGVDTATERYEVFVGDSQSPNYTITPPSANGQASVSIAGLTPETDYKVRIRVRRGTGSTAAHSTFVEHDFRTLVSVGAVSNIIRKSGDTDPRATFVWSSSGTITSYVVSVSINGAEATTSTVTTASFRLATAAPDGATVDISVTPRNGSANGETRTVRYTMPYNLAAPGNLRVTERAGTTATIAWDATPNADGYNVFKGNTLVAQVTNRQYQFTGLSAADTFTARVVARRTGEENSDAATVTIEALPEINLRLVSKTHNSITIAFDTVGGVASYQILRDGVVVATATAGTTHTFTGLDDYTQYTVGVRIAGSDDSTLQVRTDVLPLTAPAGLTLTPRIDSIRVSWTANPDANGYNIYRNGVKQNSNLITATSYSVQSLSPGSTHTIAVEAVKTYAGGVTSTSPRASAQGTTLAQLNLRTTAVGETVVTIAWDSVQPGATYRVSLDGTVVAAATLSDTYTFTGLDDKRQYSVEVRATAGSETLDSTIQFTTAARIPGVPGGVVASNISASGTTLTWNAAANATSYEVYRDGSFVAAQAGRTQYIASNLDDGTEYDWQIVAVRTYHDGTVARSARSATVSATTELLPTAPEITITNLTDDSFDVSWSADHTDSYEFEIDGTVTTPDNPTSHSLDGLDEYEEYVIKVTAVNNWGKTSSEQTVRTAFLVPGSITLSNGVPTRTSITWNWTAAQDATRYKLTRSDGMEVFVTALTYEWDNLDAGEEYTLTVTPQREYATGLFSDGSSSSLAVQTAPPVLPGIIQLQVGDVDGDSIEIEFTAGNNTDSITFVINPADADPQTITTNSNASGSVTFDGLTANTQYNIEATPSNGGEAGTPSFISAITDISAPKNLATQNIGPGQVLLTWDDVPGAEEYNLVFYTTTNQIFRTTDTFPENQRVVLQLINGVSWTFEVRAIRGGALGAAATISATPSATASAAISGRLTTLPKSSTVVPIPHILTRGH